MKILIAVDGSDYTKRMLAYLAAHEELLGTKHDYTVVHSVLAVPPLRAAAFVGAPGWCASSTRRMPRRCSARSARSSRQGDHRALCPHSSARGHINCGVGGEEGRFDLLVMGSHGHGELANLVLGSVVTKVLAKCKTPLLLIR